MALKEQKKAEWEKTLRELELMDENDCIENHTAGDYWTFASQKRGNYFFTKEKFIFVSGFGLESFSIKYTDIKDIKTCMINFFIPTGMLVTADNQENGKTKKYKCSVLKRKQWISYLGEKSHIN